MKTILRMKWFILIIWVAVIAGLFSIAPNIGTLVKEKGQVSIPKEYSSTKASEIMKEIQSQKNVGDETQVALVFHNDKKLTDTEIQEAEKAVKQLEEQRKKLGITEILSPFTNENLKDQLISKDGKTILTSLTISWNDREKKEVSDALYSAIQQYKVDHYYTSNWLIGEDINTASEEGLKKTEGITVVFILAVLLLVFRSIVAPFIPLFTVGLAYLASQSIVSILVDQWNFPISSYTQIFLVAILFGIGTDYCILLLSRFKEELSHHDSTADAILATYRNAGRTVFFSGMAVMVGFAAVGFSQFNLYKSASAIAVGVALLLLALFTFVPVVMLGLGQKLFWPSKGSVEHGDSKIWEYVGRFSLKRPFVALLVVAAVCVPFLVTYDGKLSFNSLDEISGDKALSIKAFKIVADSFGPGEAMPTTIVIKNDEAMDSMPYVSLAENISRELTKVSLVDQVRSVTRPTGAPIKELYVSNQAETLHEGLEKGQQGIDQISAGLHTAGDNLSNSAPQLQDATKGINTLISGTNQMQSGLSEIQTNLTKIENGIRQGSAGSDQIRKGLEDAQTGAEKLLAAHKQLQAGYNDVGTKLSTLVDGYQKVEAGLQELSKSVNQIQDASFDSLEKKYDGLGKEDAYEKMKVALQATKTQLPIISSKIAQLNDGLSQVQAGVTTANGNYAEILKNQTSLGSGLEQLIAGIEQQKAGLDQLANGQGQIVGNMPKLTNGLSSINTGQKKLLEGFSGIDGQIGQLTNGLQQSADGLGQISVGLDSATNYVSGLSKQDTDNFYLPQETLQSKDFQTSLDTYLSKDRKIMKIEVILKANPYSNQALNQVDEIKQTVQRVTKGTKLENAQIAVGGVTSNNTDTKTMSDQDYSKTVVYMLVAISIVLVFLFRSILMPAYIIGSLLLTFYTTMGINEAIYVNLLGFPGINWVVPFFGFVILIALGVDYSIFLMERFNEYQGVTIAEAMLEAMKKMGTVIISAAIILGGTFAAMMPSGMLSLLQIASIVLVGLFLYAFIILPLFIPVMVKNFGKANWWPFKRPSNR
ncbi:MMPL family transporter [Ectobacillus panaciterrae]|uniref:MMPL family transporter n=1 Tax=Ectobacillus panaciterrae TaxID=363872 RepID=UPI00040CA243|nr:MMPL family transporter [Ectobacillus panaciterrae]